MQTSNPELDRLREDLRKMDDKSLREFGRVAAKMCKPVDKDGKPQPQVYTVQLAEAQAEWKRRHPDRAKLPKISHTSAK